MKATQMVLGLVALLAACADSAGVDDNGPGTTAGPALTATAIPGGTGQSALRGLALSRPLQVRVDSGGVPVPGVNVSWVASAGSVQIASNLTDETGVATAYWTLGSTPGSMTVDATVEGTDGSPIRFAATALPLVVIVIDSLTNGQSALVGSTLDTPLSVTVLSEGVPSPGATVYWVGQNVTLAPAASVTDLSGIATTTGTLTALAGAATIRATTAGIMGPPAILTATALPLPGWAITREAGDSQTLPANLPLFDFVSVVVTDEFGNPVEGQEVTWTVESGPLSITTRTPMTSAAGASYARVAPGATAGVGVLRAAISGGAPFVEFTLTVSPPIPVVILDVSGPQFGFVSRSNGTSPAVDTLPVGGTMTWLLSFSDLEDHAIASVGVPSFVGGSLGYGADVHGLSVTFTTPGVYLYEDPYWPFATGTLVVQ